MRDLRTILLITCFVLICCGTNLLNAQDLKFIHYTNNDGLPYSGITDFREDKQGFMWVAMRNSVCRFDGYEFTEYFPLDSAGNREALRTPLLLNDGSANLYITSGFSKLYEYNELEDKLQRIKIPEPLLGYSKIISSYRGGFWVISGSKVYYYSEEQASCQSVEEVYPFATNLIANKRISHIVDSKGVLYLLSESGLVIIINSEFNIVDSLDISEAFESTSGISLFDIDPDSNIWIGNDNEGLANFSGSESNFQFFSSTNAGRRILHNIVRSITYDKEGKVWMGTENGLNIWNSVTDKMSSYRFDQTMPEGLNSNAIYKLYIDKNENVWIGTYFGGINIWYAGKDFFSDVTQGFGPYDLGGKEVSCITEDPYGNIWVGLEGNGVNVIDSESGTIKRLEYTEGKNSLSYNNVHAILYGPDNKVYIGTYTGGLNVYDPITGLFECISTENNKQFPSNDIYSLLMLGDTIMIAFDGGILLYNTIEDKFIPFYPEVFSGSSIESLCRVDSEIWISRRNGVSVWNIKDNKISEKLEFGNSNSISFITGDSDNNVWLGDSYSGLYQYKRESDTLLNYNYSNGFPDSRIFGLIEGTDGWYWVSTTKGLIRFNPESGNMITYNTRSGLPFNQFNYNAFYKDSNKRYYFGGINGLIYFDDNKGNLNQAAVEEIVFSSLRVFNDKVSPGKGSVIETALNLSREIKLTYRQNIFSVYFSALNFTHPGRVQYSYFLEGFNDEWISTGNLNYVSFTSLPPGDYKLRVKASFDNEIRSSKESEIIIRINPPFYLSIFAFIIYALILLGSLLLFYSVSSKIEKTKALTMIERSEKMNARNLSQAKLEFFTNVSHELKTPLTLIIGPLTNLVRSKDLKTEVRNSLIPINDNARRLLALINQLMEFRRADLGKANLKVSEGDINQFTREIKEAFDNLADIRNIDYSIHNLTPFEPVWFDHEKVERVLFNLLSNAFKYTEDGGRIILRIKTGTLTVNRETYKSLVFEVEDTGKGIEDKDRKRIFERFYKADDPRHNKTGSGIGLALVSNFVELHKGEIMVDSKPGKGSIFSFSIPCCKDCYGIEDIITDELEYKINTEELVHLELSHGSLANKFVGTPDKSTVLIADDNIELLSFLSESIAEQFNVVTAINGKDALEKIEKNVPDIIISDVLMPEMDGFELTAKVKSSLETSHIPVILLSAKAEVEDKYEGLMTGADAYIEKPFYPHLLLKHIENILSTREKLISTFKDNLNSKPSEIAHTKSDKEFIENLSLIIHNNIDNPDLDVSFLVKEMCVSRSLLHLKLKKIANCSATGFIRTLRLRLAAKFILEEDISFSEAAYRTGFSSPAFFSRRFKEYFGKTPSQFIEDSQSAR